MIQETPTAGIVLAAGTSTRFGRPKQLLHLKNKCLIEWVLDAALDSRLSRIVLVLGYCRQKVLQKLGKKLRHPKLQVEVNSRYENGQSSSLQLGLSKVIDSFEAVMFLLADQPLVDAATLNMLMEYFWSADKDICVPTFAGTHGNPCIFGSCFYPQIMNITGDIGARRIIQANPKQVQEVRIQNPHFFLDVDTPADLEKIKKLV